MLEHVLSEELEALIAAKLGNPTHDPHGDPIPSARPRDRGDADARASPTLEPGDARHVRARLRRRPGDAALPGRARDRARRRASRSSTSSRSAARCSSRFGDEVARRSAASSPTRCAWRRRREPAAHAARGRAARRRRRAAAADQRAARSARAAGASAAALALLGPAFVAAVAYIDPGNFATNIAGGAKYGYLLVWVIVAANLMAMLVQYLSAKIGIATGRNLPELCREHFPRPVTWGLWVQAEAIAIATDLAEFVGAAIALNLLFGVPPFAAGLITAVVAFAILALQTRGYRRFELAIAGLLGIVCLGFLYDLAAGRRRRAARSPAGLVPGFDGTDSVLLAVGILGATVMPHVVYLHSALTQRRIRAARTTTSGASCCASSALDVVHRDGPRRASST